MLILIAYDIALTRRRNKVVKILSEYGERVNLSVFECEFKKLETFEEIKKQLKEIIKPKEDHIRYYFICEECRKKISVQGFGTVSEDQPVRFV
jgi:CRISPR-associated protein Cas2